MAEIRLGDAPPKVRTFYDKGVAAMERGNMDYAMDMFIAALDVEPGVLEIRRLLRAAEVKLSKSKKSGAFASLSASAKGIGSLVKISAKRKSDPLAALTESEKLMRLDPFNMQFVTALCESAEAAQLPEVAIQTLEIVREHDPANTTILERLALLYRKTKQFKLEHSCWEVIVKLKPHDSRSLKALKDAAAQTTMDKDGWEGAESYRDVMKDEDESERIEQENKAVKSVTGLDALIDSNLEKIRSEPENINYRRALAELYLRAKKFDQAIEALKECQRRAGGADPQVDRALTAAVLKKFDAEIGAAEQSGDAALLEQKKQELDTFRMEDAEDRVRRYPNDLQFKYDLGVLLYEHGKYMEAIQQFQQSQRNPQRRIRSLYHMAQCFKAKNQFDIAVGQLESARKELSVMDETKKDILYELGSICDAMGDKAKAVGFYKEIYAVDIGYRDVSAKIEQAYQQ
ncbi:MAG: hypothetical protein K9M45_08920 [Kiritimatiellales bacterium]|nr:hypothetical protein [Kiritimatiellales bacterium]